MSALTLAETGRRYDVEEDNTDVTLACPDCALVVHISVEPASETDSQIASLVASHRYAAVGAEQWTRRAARDSTMCRGRT